MSSDQAMVDEFMAEVNDKYYPQIMEGIESMESGDLAGGLEAVARPLHTIKGVTGFMAGFEDASTFTHKVEDYLKKLKSGEIEATGDATDLASRGVNQVFAVLEQIHSFGALDQGEAAGLLEEMEKATATEDTPAQEQGSGPTLDILGQGIVLSVGMRRVHTPDQREMLIKLLGEIPDGSNVLLDFDGVLSMGSASWEDAWAHAGRLSLSAANMAPAVKETYYSWEFDRAIAFCRSKDDFTAGLARGGEQ